MKTTGTSFTWQLQWFEWLCLQKFIYWNITPNIEGRAFEGWLGHVSEALMDRISAPMKNAPELPSHSCHEKNTTKKVAFYEPESGFSPGQICWHLDIALPESRTGKNKFLLYIRHPVCGICYSSQNGLRQYLWCLLSQFTI